MQAGELLLSVIYFRLKAYYYAANLNYDVQIAGNIERFMNSIAGLEELRIRGGCCDNYRKDGSEVCVT